MNMNCVVCREPVQMRHGAFREIVGWEEIRKDGGANKIVDRVTTGQVMHHACRLPSRDKNQGVMFDEDFT
jgi:hypothetical protein